MNNREIYALFRAQSKYLKFSDFLENNIEWYWETEVTITQDNFGELLIDSARQALDHAKERSDNES